MAKQQYLKTEERHAQNVAKHLHIVQRITGFRANHFLEIKSDIKTNYTHFLKDVGLSMHS